MLDLLVDLHIHTVLSPCAEIEMIPPLIVRRAQALGLGIIAITDHNCTANARGVMQAAQGTGITVLPGIEVQTREEVHMLCLFQDMDQADALDRVVAKALPDEQNRAEFFGAQYVVDAAANHIRTEERLLATSTTMSVEQVVSKANALGGLCLPAHIDRSSYSLLGNLGFIPPDLAIAGVELSRMAYNHPIFAPLVLSRTKTTSFDPEKGCFSHGAKTDRARTLANKQGLTMVEKSVQLLSGLEQYGVIINGDAHRLDEMGARTRAHISAPTIVELQLALSEQQGRYTYLVTPPK